MNDKLSNYNIEVEFTDVMLLYNSLTDKILPLKYEEYAIVETLLENLKVFEEMYPDLYTIFKNEGFIIEEDFDELSFIKFRNKKAVYSSSNYHITINPTLDCNLKCWYCSVGYAGAKHNCERMSDEITSGVINHIKDLIVNRKIQSLLLDWFGGEPTMYFDEVIVSS